MLSLFWLVLKQFLQLFMEAAYPKAIMYQHKSTLQQQVVINSTIISTLSLLNFYHLVKGIISSLMTPQERIYYLEQISWVSLPHSYFILNNFVIQSPALLIKNLISSWFYGLTNNPFFGGVIKGKFRNFNSRNLKYSTKNFYSAVQTFQTSYGIEKSTLFHFHTKNDGPCLTKQHFI